MKITGFDMRNISSVTVYTRYTDSSDECPNVVVQELAGKVRRFGPHGVLDEIVRILDDERALIRVLDTGEETPYALDKIMADPTD